MNGFGLIKDPRETDIKTLVLANTDKRKDKWLYLNRSIMTCLNSILKANTSNICTCISFLVDRVLDPFSV